MDRASRFSGFRPVAIWEALRAFFGNRRAGKAFPLTNVTELADFLDSRANFVAQTSLYGYIRTRAGMQYPVLFENQEFIQSMNIAKWQIWASCLSDIAVYAGILLAKPGGDSAGIADLLGQALNEVLTRTGIPEEAGPEFPAAVAELAGRIGAFDYRVEPRTFEFSGSQDALVYWAPIVDKLKRFDDEIVRNSIRFRWLEVKDQLERNLDPERLLANPTG